MGLEKEHLLRSFIIYESKVFPSNLSDRYLYSYIMAANLAQALICRSPSPAFDIDVFFVLFSVGQPPLFFLSRQQHTITIGPSGGGGGGGGGCGGEQMLFDPP
jgi:hypothetical protein